MQQLHFPPAEDTRHHLCLHTYIASAPVLSIIMHLLYLHRRIYLNITRIDAPARRRAADTDIDISHRYGWAQIDLEFTVGGVRVVSEVIRVH